MSSTHDTFLQFVASKYEFAQDDAGIADLTQSAVNQIASEPRRYVRWLFDDYQHGKRALNEAEEGHLNDAIDFAKRAWRRPLKSEEADRLRRFYWRLRQDPDQDHDAALRSLLARILVSPAFIYRLETHTQDAISDVLPTELANRLSFFLWSSGPDKHLHDLAATGKLVAPFELENEIRRLLKAPQIRRFASEFFGQWLGFYQFDHFRGVDAERFPEFTETIKQDMFAEAVSFFEYVMRHDRPIGELLFADYTFLTPALAKHYGVTSASITKHHPTRATGLQSEHRGGLLQLGAILTSTSAPLRTSAVKRGDWILRRILGTPVPPPPADAGSIPADDILDDGLTVRARLEAHRKDPTCANCHSRIDPLGFALEHFDAIGRWREGYRDGQQIDDSGILSDGSEIRGIDGLHAYLRQNAALFQRNLATKMLGYALGRSTLISDQALIDDLANTLTLETPISELIVRIVQSPQFQKKRGPAHKTGKGKLESTTELSKLTL